MNFDKLLTENKEKDSGIRIPDNWKDYGYASDKFSMPEHYKAYIDHVMIPKGLVMDRTEKMGKFSENVCKSFAGVKIYNSVLDLFNSLDREHATTVLCVLKDRTFRIHGPVPYRLYVQAVRSMNGFGSNVLSRKNLIS